MRVLFILTLIFSQSSCQDGSWCDSDECYTKYHEQIENYKDEFRLFDEFLQNLQQLNNSLVFLREELKMFPNRSWIDNINAAKAATEKITIPDLPTEDDIKKIRKQIDDWFNFIKSINKTEDDLLSIPKSTEEEITFIESILDKRVENCLKKFDEDLNNLFETMASFLKFEEYDPELEEILKEAENNRKRAQDIFDNTTSVLKKGKELEKAQELAYKTLVEAEKFESLKKQISVLLEKEDLTRNNVDELIKKFNDDFQKLLKKYKISRYEVLLDNLSATYEELYELTGGEPVLEDDEDVKMYLECLDCYQEFLIKCSKNRLLSDKCLEVIPECGNIL